MNWRPLLAACVIGSCLWVAVIVAASTALSAPASLNGGVSVGRLAAIELDRCGTEDDPAWVWSRCGDHRRGVVTMWGTVKVVSCGDFHWLARHHDLDHRSTPVLRGDWGCGR
jgi:hypothetical protein